MKRLLIVAFFLCCSPLLAQTTFFVDPPYTGGANNGSSAHPWTSLTSGCTTINTTLATTDVIVYFSATQSQASGLNLGCRTNTGTHQLTFNGTEQVNSNDGINNNVPNWASGTALVPCVGFRCAATAPWIGHQYTVTGGGGGAVFSNNNVNACQNFINVLGFKFIGSGQVGVFTYLGNTTIAYNTFTDASGNIGPTVYIGPGQHGPCNASTSNAGGPDNVTFEYNWVHDGYGECLYDGATTSDPPGGPASAEYTTNGMSCTTTCSTGSNHLLKGNTNESCAVWGGQGDGMDIKDGHINLSIIGNTIRPSLNGGTAGADGQGIVYESCKLIAGNYIEQPNHEGLAMFDSWNNSDGRTDNCQIRNNMVVNVTGGTGHKNGFEIQAPGIAGANQVWSVPIFVLNNTFSTTLDPCITVSGSSIQGGTGVVAENNICNGTGGGLTGGAVYSTHDFNEYFNATGVTCPVAGETHSICTNPKFVSAIAPFIDTNFKVQATSPAISAATNLTTTFTDDYFGNVRPSVAAWTIGASEFNTSSASTPTFSPVAGTYLGSQSVTISTASAGAIICYNTTGSPSTNGSTGCATGTLYFGAVTVSTSQTLFAVAGGTGFADSTVGTAAYTINPSMKMSGVTTMSGSAVIQ